MGDRRGACRVLLVELKERDDLKDTGVDGGIILKLIFKIKDGGFDCVDIAQDMDKWGCYECGNDPSGSIKCGCFLGYLKTC